MARHLRTLANLATLSLAVALTTRHEDVAHPKHAWVSMAFPMEGLGPAMTANLIHEAYGLASSIRMHSQFPLVLLTDLSMFHHESAANDFKNGMEALGVHLKEMQHLKMPEKFSEDKKFTWAGAWNKLQVFNMTDWDRLVWLDTDGMLTRNMDHLFDKKGTWSQADDWFCDRIPNRVCSGLVSFKPDREVFQGILKLADTVHGLEYGDQELIERYFKNTGEPVQTLPFHEAAFGQCGAQFGYMPGFLHKPDQYPNCLRSMRLFAQGHEDAAFARSRCMHTEMGRVWRGALCASNIPNDIGFTKFCNLTVKS